MVSVRRAGWIPSASFTTAVLVVHAFRCVYCGDPTSETDHIVPRADGGGDGAENRTACCDPCNLAKGDRRLRPDLEEKLVREAAALAPEVERLHAMMRAADAQARGRRMQGLLAEAGAPGAGGV